MTDRRYDRRTVLKSALAGLAALPAAAPHAKNTLRSAAVTWIS